jgi:hypothetical protein
MNVTKRITQSLVKLIKSAPQIAGRTGATKDAHSQRITRRVAHALALTPRGAVWNDVLAIDRIAIARARRSSMGSRPAGKAQS